MRIRSAVAIPPVVLLASTLAARSPGWAEEPAPLRVHAAASLTEIVEGLASSYGGARVEPSFGASSVLARQIGDGAPADVFLSANPEWVRYLEERGVIDGKPIVFARNQIVCIAARGSPLATRAPRDVRALLDELGADGRLAIADEGVPAGEYARAALKHLGLIDAARPFLVGQKDVRAVLHAVERGELDTGFVYSTDAKVANVAVLFAFDPSIHPPIEYVAAVIRDAPNPPAARAFLEYLRTDAARALLSGAGFALP